MRGDESSRIRDEFASTLKACAPRTFVWPAVLFLATALIATAQDPPAPKSTRISFLPPPLEGSISLGVYDTKGKLVRVLHREAAIEDFTVGQDALSTMWDGKNDAGEALPAGKYHARGYVVGEVEVEGVAFFFNDWVVVEESPHLLKISRIWVENGGLILEAQKTGGKDERFLCSETGSIAAANIESLSESTPVSEEGDAGKDETRWVFGSATSDPPQMEVRQLSATGELLRRLAIAPNEPEPVRIAARKDRDQIFLLEQSETVQRLRSLTLVQSTQASGGAVSDWKVDFVKSIVRHKDFTIENGKPVLSGGKTPAEKIAVKLQPNPLRQDAKETVDLAVGYDANGSFLKTGDGLPLQSISETPHLTRIVISPRGEKALDVFQDDDAVVEQFRLSGLDQMMAFDCGAFDLN